MVRWLALAALSVQFASCNVLQLASWGQGSSLFTPPDLSMGDVALASSPPLATLARWYCPELIGTGGSLACSALFGAAPSPAELSFVFTVPIDVTNPNAFPLPALEALVALTLFPATSDRTLGAVCVSFCGGDATCDALPDAGTCASSDPELRDAADFAGAAFRWLTLAVTEQAPELVVPTIEAHGTRRLTLALSIDADTLLDLLAGEVASRWSDFLSEQAVALHVPYAIEGSVWLVVEGLGRLGVGFGPVEGQWTLE
jgi:hypothetical protein